MVRRRKRYHKVVPLSNLTVGSEVPMVMERGLPLAPQHEHEDMDRIRDLIENWPDEEERDLMYARFYEQLSYSEMAVRFGFGSKETPRRRLQRAVDKVAACLNEEVE